MRWRAGTTPIRSHFRSCKNCSDDSEVELAKRFVGAGSEVAGFLAIFFTPVRRVILMASSRRVAIMCGPFSVRIWERSSRCLPCLTLINKRPANRGALPSGHPEWPYSAGYARHRAKAAIMMRLHQGVPAFPFCGKDGPYLNAVQVGLLA